MGASTGSVVAVIAAAHARRIREVMDAFRLADATAPERAKSLEEVGARHQHEIDALARDGILVQEPGGGWWLSERAYITHRDRQPKRAVKAVLAVVIVLLLVILVTLLATARRTARLAPATPDAAAESR